MRSHDRRVMTIGISTSASTIATVTNVIGGAETISTTDRASDDDGLGEDVDRRSGDQLIGDVGRARHRLDQRCRSPPGMKEIVGGEIAREQPFGGDRRRSIDGALPQPFGPRQERGAQHVEDADAKGEQRDQRARIARRPHRPQPRHDGRRSHLLRIDDEPQQSEHRQRAGGFDQRRQSRDRHEQEPSPALARRQPAEHRS